MNIIIYNEENHASIKDIYNKVGMFEKSNIIRIKDHANLKDKLFSCVAGESIVVAYINKQKDMTFLEKMEKYFIDVKLLIYLNFKNDEIISRAYAMYPRMVISNDSSKELLPDSIEKIIKKFLYETQ